MNNNRYSISPILPGVFKAELFVYDLAQRIRVYSLN